MTEYNRIIICGGRDYADTTHVGTILQRIHDGAPTATIITGGARGADRLAQRAASALRMSTEVFPAYWTTEGKSAGTKRNIRMLDAGADLVVAFPGGVGTAHMTSIALRAGVRVWQPQP